MAEQRVNPYREFDTLRREIDRLFESFDGGTFGEWPFSRVSFLPGRAARAYPLLNVSDDENSVYIEALAPGIDPDSLKITLTRDQLTIAGEKPPLPGDVKMESFHRNERSAGRFARTVTLPAEVADDKIKADYRDGLLLITLPKAEEAKPKQITVNVK